MDSRTQSILTEIAARISEQQFETWFRNIDFSFVPPALVRIRTPNRFHQMWIARKFWPTIEEIVRKLAGRSPRLDIEVEEKLAKSFPFDPPASPPSVASADSASAPPDLPSTVPLNPAYTFDHFVVGPSNQLAHAAASAVLENPGRTYNPLFLHGNPGLGKTHLMHAVCHALHARRMWNVCYVPCETFTNQYIGAIESGDIQSFRQRYRYVDLLLIDDVHFLSGKERTQDEFFHTFNELFNHEKQIVLSSDRSPLEIREIEDRLVSRFKWGLVARIDPPSLETRIAIVRKKARARGREIPDEVSLYLAESLCDNAREIEGAVNRILGLSTLNRLPISLDLAREALVGLIPNAPRVIEITDIQKAVAEHFSLRLSELQSRRRTKALTLPRQVGMYLARRSTKLSLEEIGAYFGGRDHTTVRYAIDRVEHLRERDPRLRGSLSSLCARLGLGPT
ncbi:MAG: chromosomal replication initiator protein DnaA [Planctomycetes bacterium]|nr:chromosomal replication initiator protein DnaA [Planctomycetota bacterium]